MQGLLAISNASHESIHSYLRTLVDLLLPIVKHPLTNSLILPLLESLGHCLQPHTIAACFQPIAFLIQKIYAPPPLPTNSTETLLPDNKSDQYVVLAVQRVVTVLRQQANSRILPAPTFSFIFPIVKAALEKSYSFSIQGTSI